MKPHDRKVFDEYTAMFCRVIKQMVCAETKLHSTYDIKLVIPSPHQVIKHKLIYSLIFCSF